MIDFFKICLYYVLITIVVVVSLFLTLFFIIPYIERSNETIKFGQVKTQSISPVADVSPLAVSNYTTGFWESLQYQDVPYFSDITSIYTNGFFKNHNSNFNFHSFRFIDQTGTGTSLTSEQSMGFILAHGETLEDAQNMFYDKFDFVPNGNGTYFSMTYPAQYLAFISHYDRFYRISTTSWYLSFNFNVYVVEDNFGTTKYERISSRGFNSNTFSDNFSIDSTDIDIQITQTYLNQLVSPFLTYSVTDKPIILEMTLELITTFSAQNTIPPDKYTTTYYNGTLFTSESSFMGYSTELSIYGSAQDIIDELQRQIDELLQQGQLPPNFWDWLRSIFQVIPPFLNINIMPGLTIGTVFAIFLGFPLVYFFIKLLLK